MKAATNQRRRRVEKEPNVNRVSAFHHGIWNLEAILGKGESKIKSSNR